MRSPLLCRGRLHAPGNNGGDDCPVLVLGLLIVSLTSLLRLEQADSHFYDRVMNNDRVADRFRTDVAQATSAP